ncbi:hypothetical protein MMC28_003323 [Mycoblastus sanguinarius]|nr:hypothetical protein [Mycoblastus sanguinarius]
MSALPGETTIHIHNIPTSAPAPERTYTEFSTSTPYTNFIYPPIATVLSPEAFATRPTWTETTSDNDPEVRTWGPEEVCPLSNDDDDDNSSSSSSDDADDSLSLSSSSSSSSSASLSEEDDEKKGKKGQKRKKSKKISTKKARMAVSPASNARRNGYLPNRYNNNSNNNSDDPIHPRTSMSPDNSNSDHTTRSKIERYGSRESNVTYTYEQLDNGGTRKIWVTVARIAVVLVETPGGEGGYGEGEGEEEVGWRDGAR